MPDKIKEFEDGRLRGLGNTETTLEEQAIKYEATACMRSSMGDGNCCQKQQDY